MRARDFLNQLGQQQIVAAIQEAEKKTSGELRVFISREAVDAPVTVARAHFLRLNMQNTRDRNAVLIFIAPRSRKFAVIGDLAVHTRCGDEFWRKLADEMSGHFKQGEFTTGVLRGIRKAGDLLAEHFPRKPDDRNELPDEVAHD